MKNTTNQTDTLFFKKTKVKTTNLDHFIDRGLGYTEDRKKPCYQAYETDIDVQRTIRKVNAKTPFLKYNPMIFTFSKYETDPKVSLFYNIDGRWNGTVYFDSVATQSLVVGDTTLNDVFFITNSEKLFNIDKLYWSIKLGLVRIDEKDGDSWSVVRN